MTDRIGSRNLTRIAITILALGVGLSFYLYRQETHRAQRAECQSVNKSIDKIRLAVISVAGYQAPIVPGASPELRAQVITGNLRRKAFAQEQAKSIPGVVCPGDPKPPKTTTTTSTTLVLPPNP